MLTAPHRQGMSIERDRLMLLPISFLVSPSVVLLGRFRGKKLHAPK